MLNQLSTVGLSAAAVSSAARVVSNLFEASALQYTKLFQDRNVTGVPRVDTNFSDITEMVARSKARASTLSAGVDFVAATLADDLIAGEEEAVLATPSFTLQVSARLPADFSGQTIGGGKVTVPKGILTSHSGAAEMGPWGPRPAPMVAKVVAWNGTGPLFWAAAKSPINGDNTTKLGSALLSVSFATESGELELRELEEPFVVTLSLVHPAPDDWRATCSYWNESQQEWVTDGILVAQSASVMDCSFNHLVRLLNSPPMLVI